MILRRMETMTEGGIDVFVRQNEVGPMGSGSAGRRCDRLLQEADNQRVGPGDSDRGGGVSGPAAGLTALLYMPYNRGQTREFTAG